ncbi:hypothetical protein V2J52_00545 [Georgenia sp. MJ173]|uniref:hypothetical protein n=1 Tax=Georgenia sunbinii TaxID=3117728 RepID=UPI002F265E9A
MAALALVVGIGAGLLLHDPLFGSSGGGNVDLATTCDYVEQIPVPVTADDIEIDGPLLWQLQALAGLAVAAHYSGAEEAFMDAGLDVMAGLQRVDEDLLNEGLDGVRAGCRAR